jgi:4-hydroxy-3-polyprenylbenzoate decarboxylase
VPNFGGKIGIDATRKGPEDGFPRPWPEEIRMDPNVVERVDALLAQNAELGRRVGRSGP